MPAIVGKLKPAGSTENPTDLSLKTTNNPEIISVSKFLPFKVFGWKTKELNYFDLQLQSRYIDFLSLQSFYASLPKSIRDELNAARDKNLKMSDEILSSLASLVEIYESTNRFVDIFNVNSESENSLLSTLKKCGLYSGTWEWSGTKTYQQYLAIINTLFSTSKSDLFKKLNVTKGIFAISTSDRNSGPGFGLFYSDPKKDPYFPLSQYSSGEGQDKTITPEDLNLYSVYKAKPLYFDSYRFFEVLTRELLFSINNVTSQTLVDLLENQFGIKGNINSGVAGLANPILSDKKVYVFEESNIKGSDGVTSKNGIESLIFDTLSTIKSNGSVDMTSYTQFKGKLSDSIDRLNSARTLFDTSNIDPELVDYIIDPINKIVKTVTTPESTSDNIVFSDDQNSKGTIEMKFLTYLSLCSSAQEYTFPTMWALFNQALYQIFYDDSFSEVINYAKYMNQILASNLFFHLFDDTQVEFADKFYRNSILNSPENQNQIEQILNVEAGFTVHDTNLASIFNSNTWQGIKTVLRSYISLLNTSTTNNNGFTLFSNYQDMLVLFRIFEFTINEVLLRRGPWKIKDLYVRSTFQISIVPEINLANVNTENKKVNGTKKDCFVYPITEIKVENVDQDTLDRINDISYPNPQKLLDKITFYLTDLNFRLNDFEQNVLQKNLQSVSKLFDNELLDSLDEVFNFSYGQIYSMISKATDLKNNLSYSTTPGGTNISLNSLDGSIITTKSAKNLLIDTISQLNPFSNIVTFGIPVKYSSELNIKKTPSNQQIVTVTVLTHDELQFDEGYETDFLFDLSIFPVWDYTKFIEGDLTFRKFNRFLVEEFNSKFPPTYDSKFLSNTQLNNLIKNHKISFILDLYLMILSGLQMDERSYFIQEVLDRMKGNKIQLSNSAKIDLNNFVGSDETLKYYVELLNGMITSFTKDTIVRMITTTPGHFSRVFHVLMPRSLNSMNLNEYQIKIKESVDVDPSKFYDTELNFDNFDDGGSGKSKTATNPAIDWISDESSAYYDSDGNRTGSKKYNKIEKFGL